MWMRIHYYSPTNRAEAPVSGYMVLHVPCSTCCRVMGKSKTVVVPVIFHVSRAQVYLLDASLRSILMAGNFESFQAERSESTTATSNFSFVIASQNTGSNIYSLSCCLFLGWRDILHMRLVFPSVSTQRLAISQSPRKKSIQYIIILQSLGLAGRHGK